MTQMAAYLSVENTPRGSDDIVAKQALQWATYKARNTRDRAQF